MTECTVEHFGIGQARGLRDRFQAALIRLAASPNLERTNRELDPWGHTHRYAIVVKSFIIVDGPTGGGIRVVRLLRDARRLALELDRDAGDES